MEAGRVVLLIVRSWRGPGEQLLHVTACAVRADVCDCKVLIHATFARKH